MTSRFAGVESLEARMLLSASAALTGHVLRIHGDLQSTNTITVSNNKDGLVDVSITSVNRKNKPSTLIKKQFTLANIKRVMIRGGVKADTITIDQTNSSFALPTRIDALAGNDLITTGAEPDVINASAGNDKIDAGAGNDLVFGGRGDDTLLGGDGNDTLWGGNGNDSLDGGTGDDKLGGILGQNTLLGGDGKDTFLVRSLDKNPTNDYKPAEDVLKKSPPKAEQNEAPPAK
ncbi:MAG: calcium-binding protein [Planctomycetota bacterium]|nr:calcium-binding protein [Planctomycetota bacterium]